MYLRAIIQKLVSFFIFSNIFLALAVTSLVFETYLILFDGISDVKYPFFLFSSTLFLYCFHRVYRLGVRDKQERLAERHWWIQENTLLFYAVMAAAAAGVLVSLIWFVKLRTILFLLPIGLLSFGYTVPCVPTSQGWKRLRDIGAVKIFIISLVLALTTVLLPVLAYPDLPLSAKPAILFVFIRRMLFIFAITVPFDIRDMEYDRRNGTATLPVRLGIKRSKQLAIGALALFALLTGIQYFMLAGTSIFYVAALILSAVISSFVVMRTDEHKKDMFYSFYLEGMMILQCLLVIGASKC